MFEYRPVGNHLNDFALIRGGDEWHLFHVIGRWQKGGMPLRYEGEVEGHATTTDFINWREQPVIPQTRLACSAVYHNERYALVSGQDHVLWSDDLSNWSDPTDLTFTNDASQWYDRVRKPAQARYISPRDPHICKDSDTGDWIMFFCNRVADGDPYGRGCVGAARSKDLVEWTVLPPVYVSRAHFYCESPHVVAQDGRYHLFFSLSPECALRHAVSSSLLGPYEEIGEGNIMPFYAGASEAIEVDGKWLFFARLLEREERSFHGRLKPGRISLPMELTFAPDNTCIFSPYSALAGLRSGLVQDGFETGWEIVSGQWTQTRRDVPAQNHYTQAPAGSVLGSAYWNEAVLGSSAAVGNFDLEVTLQMPTFSSGGFHYRAGLMLRDQFRLEIDATLQVCLLTDATGTVICTAPLRNFQLDRYCDLRVIFLGDFLQVYLDNNLLIYCPAYGNRTGACKLVVTQGEAIFSRFQLHSMPSDPAIPEYDGEEPLRAELP